MSAVEKQHELSLAGYPYPLQRSSARVKELNTK